MRWFRTLGLLLAISMAAVAFAQAEGNANFFLGGRIMDEADWEPVDTPLASGVTVDFNIADWPINIAVGLYASNDDDRMLVGSTDVDFTGTFFELSVGVLKSWEVAGILRPFVGGGLVALNAEKEAGLPGGVRKDDDTSGAVYGEGGVYWRLGETLNIGVSSRVVVGTDITLGDEEFKADYFQAGLLLGWGWE
jgi:hypothetical protein